MRKKIYFDHAATTAVDQRVTKAMKDYYENNFGNASSLHTFGTEAKDKLDSARLTIAGTIGALAEEIIFTSGGTESNNLAIKGIGFANRDKGSHIIVSAIEHESILNSCRWMEK